MGEVQRDNTSRGITQAEQTGSAIVGWKIKVRPGKGRTNDKRNLSTEPTLKQIAREKTFCLFRGWGSVAVLEKYL